jgi:hypothetical protein
MNKRERKPRLSAQEKLSADLQSTSLKPKRPKRSCEMPPVEQTIARNLIVDKVAELIYALGIIPHTQTITNIQFSDLFGMSDTELTKMTIFSRKDQEVRTRRFNVTK